MNAALLRTQLLTRSQRTNLNTLQIRSASTQSRSEDVQTAYQKLKTAMAPFITGSKSLFQDYKRSRDIKAQYVFGHELYQLAPRQDIVHVRKTSAELRKAAPVLVAFWIPIVGYTVPLVCFAFPSILPNALKSQTQRENEMRKQLANREKITSEVLNRLKEVMKDYPAYADELKLAEYGSPTFLENVKDEATRSNLYQLFDSNIDTLSSRSIGSFVSYLNIGGYLPPSFYEKKLAEYLEFIRVDDYKLRNEGLEKLTEDELRDALFARGYDHADLTGEEAKTALQKWIGVYTDRMTDSFLLHNIVLRKHSAAQK